MGTNCNIMSASDDGSIRQWRRDGEPVEEPWRSNRAGVGSMAVCPDETMVVSGSADGRLRLWNVKEGSMVGNPWGRHSAPVTCLDWSPDIREIASGSEDGTVRRWNPDTGLQIAPPIKTGHGRVHAVKYSPRGDKFASGGDRDVICVWSKDGELLIEIEGHDHSVMSLCWSNDGAHIFSASRDMTIRQWQSIDGQELVVFRGHNNPVNSICLTRDERHLVSASSDYSVCIWDLETNEQVGDPLWHDDELLALAISSDETYIASAGKDSKVYVWSMEAALQQRGNKLLVRVYTAVPRVFSNRPCVMTITQYSQAAVRNKFDWMKQFSMRRRCDGMYCVIGKCLFLRYIGHRKQPLILSWIRIEARGAS
jgi:WD40 repeat protein